MKNKTIKFISALLLLSTITPVVLFSIPQKASAVWGLFDVSAHTPVQIATQPPIAAATGVSATNAPLQTAAGTEGAVAGTTNTALHVKDVAREVLKQVLMGIARKVLQEMTASTINWINGGFHGAPLFLENPDSFFTDVVKSQVRTMVDQFGYDLRRFPFGRDFALNAINAYQNTLQTSAAHSMSNVMNQQQIANYSIFGNSGWNGFFLKTQYPQNNYVGFQTMTNSAISVQIAGAIQPPAQKVQSLLQQGMGFLSPQTCPSNPAYNNGSNEFNKPSFDKSTVRWECPEAPGCGLVGPPGPNTDPVLCDVCQNEYNLRMENAQSAWAETNTCPGGLVNTTPGSVISNQITTALNIPMDSTLQAMGLGNSLSAIFDALLNKFIGDGLDSLASAVNPTPPADNWSYDGQTLGSPPATGTNSTWNSGPDQPIILADFKKLLEGYDLGTCSNIKDLGGNPLPDQNNIPQAQCAAESTAAVSIGTCSNIGYQSRGTSVADQENITEGECTNLNGTWTQTGQIPGNTTVWVKTGRVPGDIENTQKEILLLDNKDPNNPGVKQMFNKLWPKIQELDRCLPGPDIGWKDRLDKEVEKAKSDLDQGSNGITHETNDLIKDQSQQGLEQIIEMLKSLILGGNGNITVPENITPKVSPKVAAAVDLTVNELKNATSMFADWINTEMLGSLPSASLYMDAINDIEPIYTQAKEKTDLRRTRSDALLRLNSIKAGLDTISTQPDPTTEPTKEKLLISLKKQYDAIQIDISNTTTVDNAQSMLDTESDKLINLNTLIPKCNAERAAWNLPVPGGENSSYSKNTNNSTGRTALLSTGGGGGGEPGICANDATNYPTCTRCAADYSMIGGQCTPSGTEVCLNDAINPPPSGNCTTCAAGFTLVSGQCTENSSGGTTEKQYFCKNPIKGGANHEMFQAQTQTNPDLLLKLLLINANNVLSYPKNKEYPPSAGKALMVPVNIKLNCNAIFNSINSDYQKDLPAN